MEKDNENEITITTYDKVMACWHHCMESAKEFQCYHHEIEDNEHAAQLLGHFAETEALQAKELRSILLQYQREM